MSESTGLREIIIRVMTKPYQKYFGSNNADAIIEIVNLHGNGESAFLEMDTDKNEYIFKMLLNDGDNESCDVVVRDYDDCKA